MANRKDSDNGPEAETAADYVVCLSSFFILFLCEFVATSYGLFILELEYYFDTDTASLSMVGSTLLGCSMFAGALVSFLLERYSIRVILIGATMTTTLGFALSSLSTSLLMLTLTYGVLSGISFGVVYVTAIVMVGLRFNRHRGFATGVALSGGGVGVLVLSYPIERILAEYGWRGTMLLVAGMFLNCCVFAAMIFPKKTPERQNNSFVFAKGNSETSHEHLASTDHKIFNDFKTSYWTSPLLHDSFPVLPVHLKPTSAGNETKAEFCLQTETKVTTLSYQNQKMWYSEPLLSSDPSKKLTSRYARSDGHRGTKEISQVSASKLTLWLRRYLYMSRNVFFHMLLLVMCLYTGFFQVLFYLPDLAASRGLSRQQAALLLSAYGVMNVVGRVLAGVLANHPRVDSTVVYTGGLLLMAVDTALLPHCSTFTHFVAASAVFGVCSASCISIRTVVVADVLSRNLLADAFGVICAAQGICYMVLPTLCSHLYTASGEFYNPLYLIAAMCGTSAVICGIIKPLQRWRSSRGAKHKSSAHAQSAIS